MRRARTGLRLGADQVAAAGASQRAGDGQSQPGAVVARGEWREEAGAQVTPDAGAVVPHRQLHQAVALLRVQRNVPAAAALLQRLERVGHHVLHRGAQRVRVAAHGQPARAVDVEDGVRGVHPRLQALPQLVERRSEVDHPVDGVGGSLARARQLGDSLAGPLDVLADARQQIGAHSGVALV